MYAYNGVLTILGLASFLYFVFCVSVKIKLFHYYVFVCIPPGKAVPEMTYTVSGGTLNPTHSLAYVVFDSSLAWRNSCRWASHSKRSLCVYALRVLRDYV